MRRYIRKIQKILRDRGGVTLVELVVAFALLSIFSVGVTQVLASAMRTYQQMRGTNYAVQVSRTLLEKIAGEIEDARVPSSGSAGTDDISGMVPVIAQDGSAIDFADRNGCRVTISVNADGLLDIFYHGPEDSGGRGSDPEGTDWTFDKNVYMGFAIKELHFSIPEPQRENVIRVDLTLGGASGGYSAVGYAEYDKIS